MTQMGFSYLLEIPHIWENHGLLTTLEKRWHREYNTFHLPTREATITLEDVYQILHVPIHGDAVSIIMFVEMLINLAFPYDENLFFVGMGIL